MLTNVLILNIRAVSWILGENVKDRFVCLEAVESGPECLLLNLLQQNKNESHRTERPKGTFYLGRGLCKAHDGLSLRGAGYRAHLQIVWLQLRDRGEERWPR